MKNRLKSDRYCLEKYPKVIKRVKRTLYDWDLNDIRLAKSGGANLGAFILGSCFIDHLTCLYFGADSTKHSYIEFVNTFLPDYDGKGMYESVRCKLVHNYTSGHEYAFIHKAHKAHKTIKSGKIILNIHNFIKDLEKASDKYFKLVDRNDKYKINLTRRYLDIGLMGIEELK